MTVAIDIVEIGQVAESMAEFGDRYTHRVFTAREIAYASGSPARFAARFAAKEAVVKLLRPGQVGVDPRSIEVVNESDGAPRLTLSGAAAALASERRLSRLSLSLSHDGGYAIAAVTAETAPFTSRLSRRRQRTWTRTSKSGTS